MTEIRFGAGPAFVRKLRRAQVVCSHSAGLEAVLERALDELLARHDPARRLARRDARQKGREHRETPKRHETPEQPERREQRETHTQPKSPEQRTTPERPETRAQSGAPVRRNGHNGTRMASLPGADGVSRAVPRSAPRSRHVPAAVRDVVALRDGLRCTYVGPNGVRCSSRRYIQFDHIAPFSLGGEHSVENGRMLCGVHNRFEARRRLGFPGIEDEPGGAGRIG